jgi:hypothetical protein
MTIEHSSAMKQAAASALVSYVGTGAGTAKVKIYDATAVLLVSITLEVPAFALSGDAAEMQGTPSGVGVAAGIADNFELLNENDDVVMTGAVSADELSVDNANIAIGETCRITAFSWALP